jgi:hypothetical protein
MDASPATPQIAAYFQIVDLCDQFHIAVAKAHLEAETTKARRRLTFDRIAEVLSDKPPPD